MFLASKQKLAKIVQDNYEEISSEFDITRKKELPQPLFDIAQRVKEETTVLDASCGNGRLIKALDNKVVSYIGFDASNNLLDLAKKNYPNNDFVLANLTDYKSWPQGLFDYVFCLAAWHHVPGRKKQLRVLNNLASKLKPGGELIISVWNFHEQKKFFWQIIKSYLFLRPNELIFPWKKTGSLRYYHAFSRRALNSIIKKSGLEKKEIFAAGGNYYLVLGLKEL